ncbi:MAG: hypothetical protein BGO98_05480 [Myxococcales bacterium 68-20]|nr:response regulator [Myxococcales bacterium]OJY28524.1 MAG: hypothetical protein BGO98_05480 [Myxococcales bacterium 68-20]
MSQLEANVVCDSTGRPEGGWEGESLGSERMLATADAEARARAREEHLRAVVETTPECVKLVACDGTLLQMNPAGLSMVGASRAEDVVGRNIYDLLIAPEHRDVYRAFNERVCGGTKETLEFDMIGLSGERRHMETHAAPLRTPDGTTAQLALTRDVTERRKAEQALRESDRRKDEFIAMLAHELRNPLAPLRSALSLLGVKARDDDTTANEREVMERQVNHLVRLVDDLLEVSRIDRGMLELRRERIELGSVVHNAMETSIPLIREAGHRLEVELPQQPLWLHGDPVRLAQIFSNLLNNAARFTERGGRITLVAKEHEGAAWVSVRDTGVGFAQEFASRLFEMFSKSERSSGLGIGLALSRRLAEMHGGTIEGRSEGEGRGAEFIVRLPLAAPETAAAAPASRAPEGQAPIRCRVLIADDNRDSADMLGELLRALGGDVALAYDGAEAVEVARAFHPDVAILDIGMPKLDGYQAARCIRSESGTRRPKLVALTGWGQQEDRRRAREAGFDEHLVKPPDLDALRALLVPATPSDEVVESSEPTP